jgi:chromosome partitioning protein
MTRRIAIMNYKGGTGKTSTVINLAHGLSRLGKKVLVIDTDPQGSVANYMGVSFQHSLYDILSGQLAFEDVVVNARPLLDVVPSNERLFAAEISLAKMDQRERFLSAYFGAVEGYDFVLVDCAPSFNLLNQNAILFSEEILVPVSMEYASLSGVRQLVHNLQLVGKLFGHQVKITRVVPTFVDQRYNKTKVVLESLTRTFPSRVSYGIRSCISLSESPGYRQTVFEYDPESNGASDFQKLSEEVLHD